VYLPYALERKYPNADREWAWQYVFPAAKLSRDPRTGSIRRHHLHKSVVQRAVQAAVRQANIAKAASCHTFRHNPAYLLMWSVGAMNSSYDAFSKRLCVL
jgi:integrase